MNTSSNDNFSRYDRAQGPGPIILGLILVVTFVVGVALGFLGRPVLIQDLPVEVKVTVVSNAGEQTTAQENQSIAQATPPAPTTAPTESETSSSSAMPTPTIMDFVLSDARHFLGSDSAPITIVEFSDFK